MYELKIYQVHPHDWPISCFQGCIQIYKHGFFAGDFATNIVGGDLKQGMFHGKSMK